MSTRTSLPARSRSRAAALQTLDYMCYQKVGEQGAADEQEGVEAPVPWLQCWVSKSDWCEQAETWSGVLGCGWP
ncbi:Dynein Heavy Chain 1, Axonemal [Manis pentadactyla]|nr:Dynein Heavy Chain 1, Axonemal [Manis pentadactyla]